MNKSQSSTETLIFPDELLVRTLDSVSQISVPWIVFKLVIQARRKNDYNFFAITGDDGVARVTRAAVKASTVKDAQYFIMDYSSPLEDCLSPITIETCSKDHVASLVNAMENTFKDYWQDRPDLLQLVRHSQNVAYKPTKLTIMLNEPNQSRIVDVAVEKMVP